MKKIIILLIVLFVFSGCAPTPPVYTEPKKGILIDEIPENSDIIFPSIQHLFNERSALTESLEVKDNFINDPKFNALVYNSGSGGLNALKQLFLLDLNTNKTTQVTNLDYSFINAHVINGNTIITTAAHEDTNSDGAVDDQDDIELYLLHLDSKEVECLSDVYNLQAINNLDYSPVTGSTLFSAQKDNIFHNYLFMMDSDYNLIQLTHDEYMDFDCSWSEDGTKIAFNRLPPQAYPWQEPSGIWILELKDGSLTQITSGGANPKNEENFGHYPIGVDVDPDFSPDSSQLVFSRLKTGKGNFPFGIYELIIIDLETGLETILDSNFANMVPEWKDQGILITRQIGSNKTLDVTSIDPMALEHSLYIYSNGIFNKLQHYPNDVFPLGPSGASFITYRDID